jgi:hypothetical protein
MPSGVIAIWTGTLASIPPGWVLCNGSNGTPDLRDQFIRGSSNGVDPGGTGGATTHTHSDHAAQSHSGFALGNHAALSHSGFAVGDHSTTNKLWAGVGGVTAVITNTHSVTQPSDHAAVAHTVTQPADHALQSHVAANNLPVYYAVAFIMKT